MSARAKTNAPITGSEGMTDLSNGKQGFASPGFPTLPVSAMSISALADHCMKEIDKYRRAEPSNDQYGLELLRRALLLHDSQAWEALQQSLAETVLRWINTHPQRELARRLDSSENYVAQTFARFWQATASSQQRQFEFQTMGAALRYLRASLHAAILDTIHTYMRPQELPLPEPGHPAEPMVENVDTAELWAVIQNQLTNEREQRVAYLLFHCGLKPREIVQLCSQEFSDVQEVYHLRRNIMERLIRHAQIISYWLN